MSDPKDDGDDPEARKMEEEIEAHAKAIYELVLSYADEHQLSDDFVSDMAFEAGVHLRMMAYVEETAQPSAGGLKLALDRCGRHLDEIIRYDKKSADAYVRAAKESIEGGEEGGATS